MAHRAPADGIAAGAPPDTAGRVIDVTDDARRDGSVDAVITVGGDLSGQVAVGNNIVQVRIDALHGDLVQMAPPDAAPVVRARPRPLRLLPRRPGLFLDRQETMAQVVRSLAAGQVLGVHGPDGVGKSTLLREAAHRRVREETAGVVHLSAMGDGLEDLRQSLFDALFETDRPYRPSTGEVRQRFADVEVALLLDDLELGPQEADALFDLVPRAGVVTASERPVTARSLDLGPLPDDDTARLAAVAARAAGGQPEAAVTGATPLTARRRAGSGPLGTDERAVLGVLAAAADLRLDADQLRRATGRTAAAEAADRLAARGHVLRHAGRPGAGDRFSVAAGAPLPEGVDPAAGRDQLLDGFTTWAHERRARGGGPRLGGNDADAARQVCALASAEGRWDTAAALAAVAEGAFALSGRWEAWDAALRMLHRAADALGDDALRAFALHQRGTRGLVTGDPTAASALLREALHLREQLGDRAGAAATRHNLELLHPPPPVDGPPDQGPPAPPQPPAPGWPLWLKLALGVVLVGAVSILAPRLLAPAEAAVVPDVVGMATGAAAETVTQAGFAVVVDEQSADEGPFDRVRSQEPPAGAEAPEGTDVRVVVLVPAGEPTEDPGGGEPSTVEVPDVVGLAEADGRARLAEVGLQATAEGVESRDAPAGTVVEQSPSAGTEVPEGDVVTLRVATGPAPVAVPALLGLSRQEAVEVLTAAGLEPQLSAGRPPPAVDRAGEQVPAGVVVAQRPEQGTSVEVGTPVEALVSDRAGRWLPSFVGEPLAGAVDTLAEAGLEKTDRLTRSDGTTACETVLAQSPPEGTFVTAGDNITLSYELCVIVQ